jgi:hypothetical protein
MSLGQRLHSNMEKYDLNNNEREKYENQIRQLKTLSKSQTALLKVIKYYYSILLI